LDEGPARNGVFCWDWPCAIKPWRIGSFREADSIDYDLREYSGAEAPSYSAPNAKVAFDEGLYASGKFLVRVTFDTSVLVAASRSRTGASFALVSAIPSPDFEICLSVGLYAEWQDALTRPENLPPGQTVDDALGFVRYLAAHAWLQEIYFHWRPFLPDPDDDMILELAFAANSQYIVTHNIRDFAGCERLGIKAVTPRDFLKLISQAGNP
jgi:predicted nucleic acid-binding protein